MTSNIQTYDILMVYENSDYSIVVLDSRANVCDILLKRLSRFGRYIFGGKNFAVYRVNTPLEGFPVLNYLSYKTIFQKLDSSDPRLKLIYTGKEMLKIECE